MKVKALNVLNLQKTTSLDNYLYTIIYVEYIKYLFFESRKNKLFE